MERVCFLLHVRRDRLDEYKARHREVWPELLDALRETGWRNYSLFLREDGLLVGYVECDDFEASLEAMAERDVNSRWQAEMAQFFELPQDERPDTGLERLQEVFHLQRSRAPGDRRARRAVAPPRVGSARHELRRRQHLGQGRARRTRSPGEARSVLAVKGSGGDLGTLTAERARARRPRPAARDWSASTRACDREDEMVALLDHARFGAGRRRPVDRHAAARISSPRRTSTISIPMR